MIGVSQEHMSAKNIRDGERSTAANSEASLLNLNLEP